MKKMNFFRLLNQAVIQTREVLEKRFLEEEKIKLESERLDCLQEVLLFTKSLSWLSHEQTKERIRVYFNSRFNYSKTVERLKLPLEKKNAIQVTVSYASEKIESLIGKSTLEMITKANNSKELATAMMQFRVGIKQEQSNEWLLSDIVKLLPKPEKVNFLELEECRRELSFLGYFTQSGIKKRFESLDQTKVAHLLYILNSTDGKFALERDALFRFIKEETDSVDALLDEIQRQNLFHVDLSEETVQLREE